MKSGHLCSSTALIVTPTWDTSCFHLLLSPKKHMFNPQFLSKCRAVIVCPPQGRRKADDTREEELLHLAACVGIVIENAGWMASVFKLTALICDECRFGIVGRVTWSRTQNALRSLQQTSSCVVVPSHKMITMHVSARRGKSQSVRP